MNHWTKLLFVTALAAAASIHVLAQQAALEAQRAPDGGTTQHIDGIFIPPVPHAPFSAKVPVETSHALPDGTVENRKFYSIVARDSSGRVHNENRRIVPADSTEEPPVNYYIFTDPEAQTRTFCYPATHVCRVTRLRLVTSFEQIPEGPLDGGKRFLQRIELGNDTMDSLEVVGTREILTINQGTVGNDHPIATTKEFWYSPQLQINLSVVRKDPRNGTQTLKVTELTLTEPDPTLFKLPAGYKIEDERTAVHTQ